MKIQTTTDDEIARFTSHLVSMLFEYKGHSLSTIAALVGKTPRSLKAYRVSPSSPDFRRISPEDQRVLYLALKDVHFEQVIKPRVDKKMKRFTGRVCRDDDLLFPHVYDVRDAFDGHVLYSTSLKYALEYADRIGGSIKEITGAELPVLSEGQILRHRWRRAMGTLPEINSETACQVAQCCPHTLVRIGIEDATWGITPRPETVARLEAELGVDEMGEVA